MDMQIRARRVTAPAVRGELRAIPSKSDVHRALIAAALSKGETALALTGGSDDIGATASCLSALGARILRTDAGFSVTGIRSPLASTLDAGESGSTLRFLLPVAAALGADARFVGHGRLPQRPMTPLTDALRAGGVTVLREGEDELPLSLSGRLSPGRYEIAGNISSQYITGLLLALPVLGRASEICLTTALESAPYVQMTLRTLSEFGVHWRQRDSGFLLADGACYRSPGSYAAEGDWSSAAFPLVSGALGGEVTVRGLDPDSLQADRAILSALALAGADVRIERDAVTVSKSALRPFDFDVSSCPDLFPVLAVLAAGARGESRLTGGARLRLKESDRIQTTAAMLRALGCEVTEKEDGMTVFGRGVLTGGRVDGAGDHRIVMAAATARALADRDIEILGASAAAKSYPTYFEDLARLKGASHEIILR